MSLRRLEKLSSLYQETVSRWLELNARIPGAVIAVTNILMSEDLGTVEIFVSVWPDGQEKNVLESLKKLKPELRGFLARSIKAKFVPKLEFKLDESEKKRLEIEKLLKEAKKSV